MKINLIMLIAVMVSLAACKPKENKTSETDRRIAGQIKSYDESHGIG